MSNITYSEEDMLMLSGIQHFAFCERQWALIHIEQCWDENVRTVEGKYLHEIADNPYFEESRGELRVVRAMPLVSNKLGLRGTADVVEFYKQVEPLPGYTVSLDGRAGYWTVYPVEYKRGRPKKDDRDAVQLCAQALCLEEMLNIKITAGALYYAEIHHREEIPIDNNLRKRVQELSDRMHRMFREGRTPKAVSGKHCSLCSLSEQCQPKLTKKHRSVKNYIDNAIKDIVTEQGDRYAQNA